ncbi:hypothetical protein Asppvi_003577 [Aspergillus pseudoviridinutans]|uniref:AT hook motif protein n=1 Tax=Aspergillus pseudoviridinutans TaxID=1517512 RepID=A0A9P3BBK8_9EURO|nr:uncharacterized protein Asppvi_003577 [Aspergillus pseudoviridinutans]GIJ84726.1 hypothetical protein Asppvi_003577 [Aspergillus pseudoviridinutans]
MPMTWGHEADAKLLLGIIATSNVKPDYEALAKYMGPDCTVYAIQHRIRKLKDAGAAASADGDSSTPATPEKRKRGRPKKDTNGDAVSKDEASPKKAKKEENGCAVDSA